MIGHTQEDVELAVADMGATLRSTSAPERLSGGFTDASVWKIDIERGDRSPTRVKSGMYVLKLGPLDEARGSRDFGDQQQAFTKEHIAKQRHSGSRQREDSSTLHYVLYDVAGGTSQASTLHGLHDDRLQRIVENIATLLLSGGSHHDDRRRSLNRNHYSFLPNTKNEALREWLRSTLDPGSARFEKLKERSEMFCQGDHTSVRFEETAKADPLTSVEFLCAQNETHDFCTAMLHGDLHLRNVIVDPNPRDDDDRQFRLIDFEKSRRGFLFYDHACLQVSLLCQPERSNLDDENWLRLISNHYDVRQSCGLHGSLMNTRYAMAAVNSAVMSWIHDDEEDKLSSQRSALELQFDLAKIAAGLKWAGRPIDDQLARRAYLFAAEAADKLLSRAYRDKRKELIRRRSTPRYPGRSTPEAADPSLPQAASVQVSFAAHLLLNAWLLSGFAWAELRDRLAPGTIRDLQDGIEPAPAGMAALTTLIEETRVLEEPSKIGDFLRASQAEDEEKGLRIRLELAGETEAPANERLREMIADKIEFLTAAWLDPIREDLERVAKWKDLDRPLSERTQTLRSAYYRAGLRLTAAGMARAALADFGHSRWLSVIHRGPENALPHLRVANEAIGAQVAELLLSRDHNQDAVREIAILEGGVGGGHTTHALLKSIASRGDELKRRVQVRYAGMELVPQLAGEVNQMFLSPHDRDSRALFHSLRENGVVASLRPGQEFVTPCLMEDGIVELRRELHDPARAELPIDLFVSSFAFHHVPNGEAIIRFITNEAVQEFGKIESFDRVKRKKELQQQMATGCEKLFSAYLKSLESDCPEARIEEARISIIDGIDDCFPQAKVFMSLLDPAAMTTETVKRFVDKTRAFVYPKQDLLRILRNPQLEVLLHVRDMLRDGGWIFIADPDGTSDFNAKEAHVDKELTVANFLSADELAQRLTDLGFEAVGRFLIVKSEDADSGYEVVDAEEVSDHDLESLHPFGYIVRARRSMSRERELASALDRGGDLDPEHDLALPAEVERVGRLLRSPDPQVSHIVDAVFRDADPAQVAPTLFRGHLPFRAALTRLGWLKLFEGGSMIPTKRIHRFRYERAGVEDQLFVVTDFPHTPSEVRTRQNRVFSYVDEAEVLHDRIRSCLEDKPQVPAGSRVLDLCCGAGTLGILAAKLRPDVQVISVDKDQRAKQQAEVNRLLNGVEENYSVVRGDLWDAPGIADASPFRLIIADPPFSLRPDSSRHPQPDDGGPFGDEVSRQILEKAADHLHVYCKLLMLAYSLVRNGEEKTLRLKRDYPRLEGEFKPVEDGRHGYVWRYRHDKIARQGRHGMPLRNMVLRLADPTRPESIIYQSGEMQRMEFHRYNHWIENLLRDYVGLLYVCGEFTRQP